MDDHSWLVVGADVVALSRGWNTVITGRSKIAKIGKRDIVLEDGSRWSAKWLQPSGANSWSRSILAPADGPEVREIQALEKRRRALADLEGAVAQVRQFRDSYEAGSLALVQAALDKCKAVACD